MIREACVDTAQQAFQAEAKGAERIELCADLDQDGLTPPVELVKVVCTKLSIPVMVMIRPRPGNFIYQRHEVEEMIASINSLSQLPIAGIVFGALTNEGWPDAVVVEKILQVSDSLDVTFHKAIDVTPDPVKAIELLVTSGISHVLTSGGHPTALKGADVINAMQERAPNLRVIAAGKITQANLPELQKILRVNQFHGKKIVGNL